MSSEKKYTQEEMEAIVNEVIAGLRGKKELSLDDMEHVAGGVWVPETHEEIDQYWDAVQSAYDSFDQDVAALTAFKLGLTSHEGMGTIKSDLIHFGIPVLRERMHQYLRTGDASVSPVR